MDKDAPSQQEDKPEPEIAVDSESPSPIKPDDNKEGAPTPT